MAIANFVSDRTDDWPYNINTGFPSSWGLAWGTAVECYTIREIGYKQLYPNTSAWNLYYMDLNEPYTGYNQIPILYVFANGSHLLANESGDYSVDKIRQVYAPSKIVKTVFSQYNWEGDENKPVCVYSDGKLMRVYLEAGASVNLYTFSKTNDSIEVEPYQPIGESLFACSVVTQKYLCKSSGNNLLSYKTDAYSDFDSLKKNAVSSTGYPDGGILKDEGKSATVYVYMESDINARVSWTIKSTSWKNKAYKIEETELAQDIPFYAGVAIGSDFASCFKLKQTLSNNYKTIESTPKTSLSLSDITIATDGKGQSSRIYSEEDILAFSYSYGGQSISFSDSSIKAYAPSSDWLASCMPSADDFELGDTISVSNVKEYIEGQTYLTSNGKSVSLASLEKTSTLKVKIGGIEYSEYQTFTADNADYVTFEYSIESDYVNARSAEIKGYITGQDEDYIVSCKLSGANSILKGGEKMSIGDDAKIQFLNSAGDIVKERAISESGAVIAYPDGYGEALKERYHVDKEVTLQLSVSPYEGRVMKADWVFVVDYYEKTLKKASNPTKLLYYVGGDYGDNPTMDSAGMELSAIWHSNSAELGSTKTESVSVDGVSFDDINTDFSGKTNYQAVGFTAKVGSQTLSGSVYVTVTKYGIDSFEAIGSDTRKYWDSGKDTFHHPEGVTFKYVYTDGSTETQSDDGTLRFYRSLDSDGIPTDRLDEASEINKAGGSVIYVVPERQSLLGEILVAKCAISFKKDSVTSVTLAEKTSFTLGNRLSRKKESIDVIAYYESGAENTLAQSAWYFAKTSPITEECDVSVVIGSDTFGIPSDMVSFEKPTPYLSKDASGFPKNYMNKADAIDASELAVELRYSDSEGNDCDYSEKLSFTKESASKGNYSVACSAIPDYVFDGSTAVELDLSADGFKDLTLTLMAYDTIGKANFSDSSTSVRVMEIIDIVGLTIKNPKMAYSVGDRFLEDDEQTIVRIFYKDGNGVTKPYDAKLSDDLTCLNIYPTKGTRFKTIQTSRTVTVSSVTNSTIYATYDISISQKESTSETKVHTISAVWFKNGWGDTGLPAAYYLVDKENTKIDSSTGERVLSDNISEDEIEVYGYLADLNDAAKNARVILFDDYLPPVDGSNNITVTYPCYEKGNADIVNKSHFGILFGNNNARNRLFISGNPDYPNMDWRSGESDSDDFTDESMANGNFAYFEDTSSATYGETDNAIVGYDIISNDKLLVLKGHSDKETTVYFRTPTLVTAINGSGTAVTDIDGNSLYTDEFSLTKGNNSVAGVSPKGVINFNGDSLFISDDKHLMGLDLTGIVGDSQRYANSRSYYIDEDLRAEDLNGAFLWTDNTHLMMVLKDKAYVTHYEMKTDSQYEWWPIDVSGISCLLKVGDVIYFGTDDGRFSEFNKDYYYDIKKVFAGVGEAKVSEEDDKERIIVSKKTISELSDDKEYVFSVMSQQGVSDEKSSIYCKWATIGNSDTESCDFQVLTEKSYGTLKLVCRSDNETDYARKNELLADIGEKVPVYLNHLSQGDTSIESAPGSPLKDAYGKLYYLKMIESSMIDDALSEQEYGLYDEDGERVDITTLWRAMLCKKVEYAWVDDIDKDGCTFSLKANGKTLDLVRYHNQPITNAFVIEIREYVPVEAYMITKPYTMGKLDYLKTVWSMALTNDTNIPSEMELCAVSNKILTESAKTLSKISKDALGLDMSEFNFESVDFEKNIAPRAYSRNRVISNLKFLTLGIRNYSGTNCVLSSMSLTYTYPYHSYGD